MTSLARFYNFTINLYDVIDDVTDWLKNLKYYIFQNNSDQGYQNTRSQASRSNYIFIYKISKKLKFEQNMPFKMLLPWQQPTP